MSDINDNDVFKKNHPLIGELTIEQILECAERWVALGKLPFVYENNAQGFEDSRPNEDHPTYRRLDLMFETKVINGRPEQPVTQRANALSKLTELTDLVRARALEDEIEQSAP